MSTHHSPHSRQSTDPAAIEAAICRYRPRLLNDQQTKDALGAMTGLVRQAQPATVMDALNLLASMSRFLADVAEPDGCDVTSLLTEHQVSEWAQQCVRRQTNRVSLQQHLDRLRRIMRAAAGLPPVLRNRRSPDTHLRPYSIEDLTSLTIGIASDDPAAAAAIAAVAASGLTVASSSGGVFERRSGGPVLVTRVGDEHRVEAPWQRFVEELGSCRVDDLAWKRARLHQLEASPLSQARLRLTWAVVALTAEHPAAQLLARPGIGRHLLARARPFVPAAPVSSLLILRG